MFNMGMKKKKNTYSRQPQKTMLMFLILLEIIIIAQRIVNAESF